MLFKPATVKKPYIVVWFGGTAHFFFLFLPPPTSSMLDLIFKLLKFECSYANFCSCSAKSSIEVLIAKSRSVNSSCIRSVSSYITAALSHRKDTCKLQLLERSRHAQALAKYSKFDISRNSNRRSLFLPWMRPRRLFLKDSMLCCSECSDDNLMPPPCSPHGPSIPKLAHGRDFCAGIVLLLAQKEFDQLP